MAGPQSSSTPLIYPPAVYIDTRKGVALSPSITPTLVGTPDLPVNNLSDAISIAALRNTNNFHIKNVLTLDRNLVPYNFFGDGDIGISGVNLNYFDATNCTFNGLAVLGSGPGFINCYNCFVSGAFSSTIIFGSIVGRLTDCLIGSLIPIPGSNALQLNNCTFVGAYTLSITGGGYLQVIGGSGQLVIANSDNALSYTSITAAGVVVILASTNTHGYCGITAAAYVVYQTTAFPTFQVDDYSTFKYGNTSTFTKTITSHSDAGDVVLGTDYYASLQIESVIVRSLSPVPANFTSIGIYANTAKINMLINPALATAAALSAIDAQVQGVGPWILGPGMTIVATLSGTGPAPVNLNVYVLYTVITAKSRIY